MLEAMPSSSPREIADAAGYRYNLNSSQIATARNRLTAMAHTERAMALQLTRLLISDDDCDPKDIVRHVKSWATEHLQRPDPNPFE